MKVWQYDSYGEYVRIQTEGNIRKINHVFVKEDVLKHVKKAFPGAKSFLCHGSRNGAELEIFQELYGEDVKVQGTEISTTATDFPNTIQWDFMNVKEEWIGQWDVVYSNSFDHALDAEKTLTVWRDQVKQDGRLFVEIALGRHNKAKVLDPLEISATEFVELAEKLNMSLVKKSKGPDGRWLFELRKV